MNASRFTAVLALLALTAGTAIATEGVSPGALDRLAVVESRCPTFSWGMDGDAIAYDLIAYVLPEDAAQSAELTADNEVLFTRVAGSATSWTPSAEQCFAPGGSYVWFVQAVTELAGDEVVEASEWSAGRYFTVPTAPSAEEMQRALEVLRRWDAANGDGSLPLFAAAVPAAATAAVPAAASGSGTAKRTRSSSSGASSGSRRTRRASPSGPRAVGPCCLTCRGSSPPTGSIARTA